MIHVAKPVLVIGDACVDLAVHIPDKRAGAMTHRRPELHGGGTGANTAVALARLGVATAFVGAFGDDAYGQFARDSLLEEGVDTSHTVALRGQFTTIVLALIDADGDRVLFGWPRRGAAHGQLAPEHIQADVIAGMAWLHASGMTLTESPVREAVLKAMALARKAGVPISFDLNLRGGVEDGRLPEAFVAAVWQAIALSDFVLGSAADEISALAPAGSLAASVAQIADSRRTVIARLGSEGALALAPGAEPILAAAFPVPVADTIGAGDAFNAGFIAARQAGEPLEEALRWGNAVAALKVTRAGARNAPYLAEVLGLIHAGRKGG